MPTVVHADDKAKAADLAREATSHFRLNEFEGALKDYTEAYRAFPEPTLLYNIGQCHRQLNHKQDAIRFFKSYMIEVPAAENRDEVLRFIQALETAVKQEEAAKSLPPPGPMATQRPSPPAVGSLRVTSVPGGAAVRFDDNEKVRSGTTPVEFAALAPGTRRVFVTHEGYESIERNVDIVVGSPTVVDLQLTPVNVTAAPVVEAPKDSDEPTSARPIYKKWWFWTAVGAVAVVGIGIGLGVGLAPGPSAPSASTTAGTFHF